MDPACRCLPFPFTFSVQKEYVFTQSQPQSPPPTPRVVLSSFVLSPDFFSRTKSKSAAVPGAGENTLRRLALFLCLDHPTKSDVTSGKKAS